MSSRLARSGIQACDRRQVRVSRTTAWSLAMALAWGPLACSIDDRVLTARPQDGSAGSGGTMVVGSPDAGSDASLSQSADGQ